MMKAEKLAELRKWTENDGIVPVQAFELRWLLDEIERWSETYTDERGTVWGAPTAWAYAKACRVNEQLHKEVEGLRCCGNCKHFELTHDEMNGLNISTQCKTTTYYVDPAKKCDKWEAMK